MAEIYVTTTIITGVNDPRFPDGFIQKGVRMEKGFLDSMKQDNWKNWVDRGILMDEQKNKEENPPVKPLEQIDVNSVPQNIPQVQPRHVDSSSPVIPPAG